MLKICYDVSVPNTRRNVNCTSISNYQTVLELIGKIPGIRTKSLVANFGELQSPENALYTLHSPDKSTGFMLEDNVLKVFQN